MNNADSASTCIVVKKKGKNQYKYSTWRRSSNLLTEKAMAELDPETLLEWLALGQGDERDIQLLALEQLCMLLLMSDNVDKCFEM